MAKKNSKHSEKELRQKIRQELEEKHQVKKPTQKSGQTTGEDNAESINSAYVKRFLREMVEEKLYSQHPEFVKCENHLGEIRWLTVFELEEEYEFYPQELSRLERIKEKFRTKKPPLIVNQKEADQFAELLHGEIEQDIEQRLEKFNRQREEAEHRKNGELESKIYQEELDSFYHSKPEYKKYRNHIGEERWMTLEEYESQEEFFEEVLSTRQKIFRYSLFSATAIAVLIVIGSLFLINGQDTTVNGYLVIEISEDRGHLYVDQILEVGYEPNVPYPVETGTREVTILLPGYKTIPATQIVEIGRDDTVRVSFRFEEERIKNAGVVRINSDEKNASIFVDGEFKGTLATYNPFQLTAGEHTIIIKKDKYNTIPPQHSLNVAAGDTMDISFRLTPESARRRAPKFNPLSDVGLVEVRSNISGAQIILDGHPTGFQSDYVLQKIPYGRHIIKLVKDGYKVYPEERVVDLNKNQKRARAEFTLTSTVRSVTIRTEPIDAPIYLNDKLVGNGNFKGSLPLGKHKLHFGDIAFYSKPENQEIVIAHDGPTEFIFPYENAFFIEFSPDGVKPNANTGFLSSGYYLEDEGYKKSQAGGPEVLEQSGKRVWLMGLAFEYRNPPGNDALQFSFDVPQVTDLSRPVQLKIWAYKTSENYPLVVKGDSYYKIEINNTKYKNEVEPKYAESDLGQSNFDQFTVNHLLRKGRNRIMISTTESSSAHLALWKIRIE